MIWRHDNTPAKYNSTQSKRSIKDKMWFSLSMGANAMKKNSEWLPIALTYCLPSSALLPDLPFSQYEEKHGWNAETRKEGKNHIIFKFKRTNSTFDGRHSAWAPWVFPLSLLKASNFHLKQTQISWIFMKSQRSYLRWGRSPLLQLQPSQSGQPNALPWTFNRLPRGPSEYYLLSQ